MSRIRSAAAAAAVLLVATAPAPAHAGIVRRAATLHHARHAGAVQPPLVYHGGPVMHSSTTWVVYWRPRGYRLPVAYRSAIDRYLRDVASASGSRTNVHAVLEQYGDATGPATYDVRVGGSVVDTAPFPDAACRPYTGVTRCLTDAQARAELRRVAAAHGWKPSPSTLFMLLTPDGVGVCEGRSSTKSACAFTGFCAYHAFSGRGSGTMIYAVVPFGATRPDACGIPEAPNAPESDATINTLSHEHREAITDPLGDGWYDRDGAEGSDKCAWWFGRQRGATATGAWNQSIGTGRYELQGEWSNAKGKCVLDGR